MVKKSRAATWALWGATLALGCGAPEGEEDVETTTAALVSSGTTTALASAPDAPVLSFGHGGIIQPNGKIIVRPTAEFVEQAQQYYLTRLEARATVEQRSAATRAWDAAPPAARPTLAKHRRIKELLARVRPVDSERIESISGFLANLHAVEGQTVADDPTLQMRTTTSSGGQTYLNECLAAGVPRPPTWGTSSWRDQGGQTPLFLFGPAKVYTFESAAPRGICIALPRYTPGFDRILALGIICMGADTSKACFWDNPAGQGGIPAGEQRDIATQMKGGGELVANAQGVCTECHAGENPFVTVPGSAVDRFAAMVPNGWVNPMVSPAWPQNRRPGKQLQLAAADGGCMNSGCHGKQDGRRFPDVSTAIAGWCGLAQNSFRGASMPDGGEFNVHWEVLVDDCGQPPKVISTKFGTSAKWHDHMGLAGELPYTGDFNGDGRDDILSHTLSPNNDVEVALSESAGTSFGPFMVWHDFFVEAGETPAVGDLNGDGKDDIITTALASGTTWVALSTGTAFAPLRTWLSGFGATGQVTMSGDFNNDRKHDIIFFKHTTDDVYVGLSNGEGFNTPTRWHSSFSPGSEIPRVGDVDGDGFSDIVSFTRGNAADVFVALSGSAGSFGTKTKWHDSFASGTKSTVRVADVNGDGFDDIIEFTKSTSKDIFVALSNGVKFGTRTRWHETFSADNQTPYLADVDGDLRSDAVNFTNDTAADVFVVKSTF